MTESVLKQIAALSDMDMDALKKLWSELYKTKPPGINRTYMIRRLTYRIQEIAYGGLSGETKKSLVKMRTSVPTKINPRKKCMPPPGTQLRREYQGIEHHVTVLADGFEYQSRRYASLSVIARVITGTRWSGPVFFGLKQS